MSQVSFINHGGSRFTCRETGDRFAIVQVIGEGYRVFINESRDVTRPTRKAALERIEQEAALHWHCLRAAGLASRMRHVGLIK